MVKSHIIINRMWKFVRKFTFEKCHKLPRSTSKFLLRERKERDRDSTVKRYNYITR